MNKESFLEVVKQQYSEEIYNAYLEYVHGGESRVDVGGLNMRLQTLMANAKVEGLPAAEFEELARTTLPGNVAYIVDFAPSSMPRRKAA